MNEWKATSKKIGTQFAGVVRRVDRADAYFVSLKGKPILHQCEMAAELCAAQHIIGLLNTEPRFFNVGRVLSAEQKLEESAFGTVTSRRGKSSTVKRRQRRRRAADTKEAVA